MKSHLRFRLEREECVRLLKEVTNETNSSSGALSNFGSIVKGKMFYGKFFDDSSFELQLTSYARGSLAPRLQGKIEGVDDSEYKCQIYVEGKIPKWNWAGLLTLLLIAFIFVKVLFIAAIIVIGLIVIANSERQIKRGINLIIETIEPS